MRVDLNCDMGESFGHYVLGQDELVMPLISSANIACGFHGGDPQVMRRTVALAAQYRVGVGAHVGFPDLVGFGRREMQVDPAELENDVFYQIGAISAFCRVEGAKLLHVKPHGALYNLAQRDERTAHAIVRAVSLYDHQLVIYAQPGSALERAAHAAGLASAAEAFADRAYMPDGSLASRKLTGAVLHDPKAVAERVVGMAVHGQVAAIDGSTVNLAPQTICVHGDTPGSVELIRRIKERLEAAGVKVCAIPTKG